MADQLDDAWAGKPEQVASLNALGTAVMRMKGIVVQRGMDQAISFSIFLRSDIYEVLTRSGLDDATKYRRHELHLKWDRAALCRMVDKRIEVAGVAGLQRIDGLFTSERNERRSLSTSYSLGWRRDLATSSSSWVFAWTRPTSVVKTR